MTIRWNDECGQSLARAASPCSSGLIWTYPYDAQKRSHRGWYARSSAAARCRVRLWRRDCLKSGRRLEGFRENADSISRQRVAHRPRPDRVEMIGQHDHRLDRERMMPVCLSERCTQFVHMLRQQPQPPLRQIDGEEAAASDEVATIVGRRLSTAWPKAGPLGRNHATI
jgi:hypothetical protein